MSDRVIHMKVKIKTLAAEARVIRTEERKALKRGLTDRYRNLHAHRVKDVREHARENLLAYGFLRGRSYGQMEIKCFEAPSWDQVKKHAQAFCPDRTNGRPWPAEWEAKWDEWLTAAKEHLKGHSLAA